MKKIFFSLIFSIFSLLASAQNLLHETLKTAQEKNELVVLNFSGSDWCIPCIKLHKNIIESEDFKKLLSDEIIVYLNADFPRNKKNQPSAEIKKENAMLADKYNPKGLFPLTILLNSDGKILKEWEGLPSEDAQTFSEEIYSFYQKK